MLPNQHGTVTTGSAIGAARTRGAALQPRVSLCISHRRSALEVHSSARMRPIGVQLKRRGA